MRLIALLALFSVAYPASAQPSQEIQRLMRTPTTQFDFGLYRMAQNPDYPDEMTKQIESALLEYAGESFGNPASFRVRYNRERGAVIQEFRMAVRPNENMNFVCASALKGYLERWARWDPKGRVRDTIGMASFFMGIGQEKMKPSVDFFVKLGRSFEWKLTLSSRDGHSRKRKTCTATALSSEMTVYDEPD